MRHPAGDRELLLLALHRAGGMGAAAKEALLDRVDGPEDLLRLAAADVSRIACNGRAPRGATWDPARLLALAGADRSALERLGARYVQRRDVRFPALLREIPTPPFGLFMRGAGLPPDRPSVAIVGTRAPTGRGLASARSLAREIAAAGLPVVSGLARGIDAAAHRGALDARRDSGDAGRTCAVLPRGIDGIYPLAHRALAASMLEGGGLLVSEYPPGTPVAAWRFPERNRILSGLVRGIIVVEAPGRSGALITADFALEQGRDVFVAAATLGGPRDAGAERLAEEGATVIMEAGQLLAAWDMAPRAVRPGAGRDSGTAWMVDMREIGDGPDRREPEGARLAAALRAELGLGARAVVGAAACTTE